MAGILNENKTDQTTKSVFVADARPLDAKTITESHVEFKKMSKKAKYNGMLVYVQENGLYHTYDAPTDTLIPFAGGSGGGSTIIIENGFRLIWKYPGNLQKNVVEKNDIVEGFFGTIFAKARYNTGPENLLTSYTPLEEYTML